MVPKYAKILESEKVERVDLTFEQTTNISMDGEIVRADELHIAIVPKALRFLIPAGASMIRKETVEAAEEALTV